VIDAGVDDLFDVDLVSGDRVILSNSATGVGPNFRYPAAVALSSSETKAYVIDYGVDSLFEVDLINGNRTVLSH
jgi:hypothetical protein